MHTKARRKAKWLWYLSWYVWATCAFLFVDERVSVSVCFVNLCAVLQRLEWDKVRHAVTDRRTQPPYSHVTCGWWEKGTKWNWSLKDVVPETLWGCHFNRKANTRIEEKDYWLLLQGGILQSVPCSLDHFLVCCDPHLGYYHSRFIHQSSQLWLQQRHLVAKRRENGRKITDEFWLSVSVLCLKGSLACRKVLRRETYGFFPFRRKVCCGFYRP
jgi:hypothetical protein